MSGFSTRCRLARSALGDSAFWKNWRERRDTISMKYVSGVKNAGALGSVSRRDFNLRERLLQRLK